MEERRRFLGARPPVLATRSPLLGTRSSVPAPHSSVPGARSPRCPVPAPWYPHRAPLTFSALRRHWWEDSGDQDSPLGQAQGKQPLATLCSTIDVILDLSLRSFFLRNPTRLKSKRNHPEAVLQQREALMVI